MDRFTYRGKRLDNGEWVYGGIEHRGIDCFIYDNRLPYDNTMPVDPQTIGQCTGFQDKNGTVIYEGDIVFRNLYVKFSGDRFCFYNVDSGNVTNIFFPDIPEAKARGDKSAELEIVGNIHEKEAPND